MVRVQFLSSVLAASVCICAPGSCWTSQSDASWDSRETESNLFGQQASSSVSKAVYPTTVRTLSKWENATNSRRPATHDPVRHSLRESY